MVTRNTQGSAPALPTSRRALIAGLAGAPAFIGIFAAGAAGAQSPSREWEKGMRNCLAKMEAETRYENEVWNPAYEADKTREAALGNPWPGLGDPEAIARYWRQRSELAIKDVHLTDAINVEMERLQEARITAQDFLIETVPAPHVTAILWKLETALTRSQDFEGLHPTHQEAILADLRRFAEREG